MAHPQSCKDPNCQLTYREHLLSVNIGADAFPTRAVNRTPGHADEPLSQTKTREKRWERDHDAFKRLYKDGVRPPRIDGSAYRERAGNTRFDIEHRPVTVDYNDPN